MEESPPRNRSATAYALARGAWLENAARTTSLELPASRVAGANARRELDTHFGGLLDGHVLHMLKLVVTELVTNSVLHSGGSAVVVHMAATPECVRVEVCDSGPGFDAEEVLARERGGLGLLLVDRIATRWGAAGDDGACVWVELEPDAVP